MVEYYLAEKDCSFGLWDRLLLIVDEGKVRIHRGESRDRFELDKNGRPVCMTWDGMSLPYVISNPLTDEQVEYLIKRNEFSRFPRRIHSARTFT